MNKSTQKMAHKKMTKTLTALAISAVSASTLNFSALAETIAITNATVHTATAQGVLQNATVVMTDGKITAINPEAVNADHTIDGQGKILAPGFIATYNQLGLVEVGAVASTRDARDSKADITFDPSLAFNPFTTAIPFSRKGGITQSIVAPQGGDDIFAGQTFVVNLSGEFDSVEQTKNATIVSLGEESKGSRAMSLQKLAKALKDTQKALDKKAEKKGDDKKDAKEPSEKDLILQSIVKGEKPLLAMVDRASDILQVLKLKEQYGLNLVLLGASDAVVVSEQIAKAQVPVVIEPIDNLPHGFDSLHLSIENAAKLEKAGVKVIFTHPGTHNLYQLRYNAGIAVAYGMSYDGAMKAMTSNVAQTFGLNSGSIEAGKDANLVLWNSDPLELNSSVEKLWINGQEYNTDARQDKLRDRYLNKSVMPAAYTK